MISIILYLAYIRKDDSKLVKNFTRKSDLFVEKVHFSEETREDDDVNWAKIQGDYNMVNKKLKN